MVAPFDIFKSVGSGAVQWIETAESLDLAKERVRVLGQGSPGKYMVLSQKTGNKLTFDVDEHGTLCALRPTQYPPVHK